jgi:hypothetical protein
LAEKKPPAEPEAFRLQLEDNAAPLVVPEEFREEIVKELYEIERSDYTEHLRLQGSVGLTAIRSLFVINAGAIIGILTFIGNHGAEVVGSGIRQSIGLFITGLVAAAACPIPGYLAQISFQEAAHRQMIDFLRIRVKSKSVNDHKSAGAAGVLFLRAGLLLAVLSLIFFCAGAWAGINALVLRS